MGYSFLSLNLWLKSNRNTRKDSSCRLEVFWPKPSNFTQNETSVEVFSFQFVKIFRIVFSPNTSERLLLKAVGSVQKVKSPLRISLGKYWSTYTEEILNGKLYILSMTSGSLVIRNIAIRLPWTKVRVSFARLQKNFVFKISVLWCDFSPSLLLNQEELASSWNYKISIFLKKASLRFFRVLKKLERELFAH